MGGTRIAVGDTMKYLGLVLDSRWDFSAHFMALVPWLMGATGALSQLLPNVGTSCRLPKALYGRRTINGPLPP